MRMRSAILALTLLAPAAALPLHGQAAPNWQRTDAPTETGPTVFHATQGFNLPTAVTAGGGEFLFEISHRFLPPISDAEDALFGLDGGVRLRLGLAYGVTDALTVGLTRSNLDDNLDLGAKLRFLEVDGAVPLQLAVAGGVAWNTEVFGGEGSTRQAHGEVIVNARLGDRVALGVVPALVVNPELGVDGEDAAFSLGLHSQVYLSETVSLVGEWAFTPETAELPDQPGSLAVEFETGGHFFRIGVTNSLRLNPTQFFGGAAQPFEADELRLGFNVTRVLHF